MCFQIEYKEFLLHGNHSCQVVQQGQLGAQHIELKQKDPEFEVNLIQPDSTNSLNWGVLKDQAKSMIDKHFLSCDIFASVDRYTANNIEYRLLRCFDYKLKCSSVLVDLVKKIVENQLLFSIELGGKMDEALSIVSVLFDFIRILDKREWDPSETLRYICLTTLVYLDMCIRDTWGSFLKYQKDYLFNHFSDLLNKEYPDPKDSDVHVKGFLVVGPLNNRLHCLLSGNRKRNLVARNSLLNGLKKGLPHLSEASMVRDCWKHKASLDKPPPEPSEDLLREVGHIVKTVFPDGITLDQFQSEVHDYSTLSGNSCFETNKSTGGALSYHLVMEQFYDLGVKGDLSLGLLHPKNKNKILVSNLFQLMRSNELITMGYHPSRGVVELRRPSFEFDVSIMEKLRSLYDYIMCERPHGEGAKTFNFGQKVQCVLIQEPLKNRPITKASFWSNALVFPLQRLLWRSLQKFPCFQLTGRWVTGTDLDSINLDLPFWKSADFSAATDNLSSLLTECVIDNVTKDPFLQEVLRCNLLNQTVSYDCMRELIHGKEWESKKLAGTCGLPPDFVMRNGQLMGSICSFPILCIINAAVFSLAWRRWTSLNDYPMAPLRQLPCLINGDDLIFKSDQDLLRIWRQILPEAGLVESPGKSYESESFAMINSVFFQERDKHMLSVPYFNMSWVTGVQKGSTDDDERFKLNLSLGREIKYFLRQYPDLEQGEGSSLSYVNEDTLKRFYLSVYHNRKDEFDEMGLGYNYPAPFGLELPFPSSKDQKKVSCYLAHRGQAIQCTPCYGAKEVPLSMVPYKFFTCNESRYEESFKDIYRKSKKEFKFKRPEFLPVDKIEQKLIFGRISKVNRAFSIDLSSDKLSSQVELLLGLQSDSPSIPRERCDLL